jgi:hypothetical protein
MTIPKLQPATHQTNAHHVNLSSQDFLPLNFKSCQTIWEKFQGDVHLNHSIEI